MAKRIVPAIFILLFFGLAAVLGWGVAAHLDALLCTTADMLIPDAQMAADIQAIFAQLADAVLEPHWILPLVLTAVLLLIRLLLPPKNGGVVFLYCLLGFCMWVGTLATALLFSRVNGIRLLDVVSVLLDLVRRGIFELL